MEWSSVALIVVCTAGVCWIIFRVFLDGSVVWKTQLPTYLEWYRMVTIADSGDVRCHLCDSFSPSKSSSNIVLNFTARNEYMHTKSLRLCSRCTRYLNDKLTDAPFSDLNEYVKGKVWD